MSEINVTIVGGGIVGCSIAAVCGRLGLSAVLIEKEDGLARGITSRNSEVSHGGMYYPTGSLKARFCVQGRRLLKDFCTSAGVGYQECGKLIVAVQDDEVSQLENLLTLGQANGVEDLVLLDAEQIAGMEPDIKAVAGLWSPRTGIVDAEGATKALAHSATEAGVQIMTSSVLDSLERRNGLWQDGVVSNGEGLRQGWTHQSDFVVNAAGLTADDVAAMAGVDILSRAWRQVWVKGNYFRINGEHSGRIKSLVYPVPPQDHSSLGVHLCVDLAGQLRLGPDVEIFNGNSKGSDKGVEPGRHLAYHVDSDRADRFFQGAQRFLPWLKLEDLSPDMSGYRPKLATQGFRDFVVVQEDAPLEGLINLIGIDSPGLTSARALAEHVGKMLTEKDRIN